MRLISVKCPDCGAVLDFEEDRKQAFCSYCGAKILINNENEYIYRYIDEADVKRADTDKLVKMKMLEAGKNITGIKFKLALTTTIAGVLMMLIGWGLGRLSGDGDSGWYMLAMLGMLAIMGCVYLWISFYQSLDEGMDYGDKIKIPDISNYDEINYQSMKELFKNAGFTNITCVPLGDLKIGILKKPGTVDSITINGKRIQSGKKRFHPDSPIVISYHSL